MKNQQERESSLSQRDRLIVILVQLAIGWLMLIPVWWAIIHSIGAVDKMTGWIVNNWILLVPSLGTLMMLGITVWFLWIIRKLRLLEEKKKEE